MYHWHCICLLGADIVKELQENSNVSEIFKEGEQFVKDLKSNTDVGALLTEGKSAMKDILTTQDGDTNSLSKQAHKNKAMLEKGKKIFLEVKNKEEAQTLVKKGKTICKYIFQYFLILQWKRQLIPLK